MFRSYRFFYLLLFFFLSFNEIIQARPKVNMEICIVGEKLWRITNHPAYDGQPSWSPDGKKIAFVSDRDGNNEIYVMDINGANILRLTNSPGDDSSPSWSHDSKWIAFDSDRDGNAEIYLIDVNGANLTNITTQFALDSHPSWSPDSAQIAFVSEGFNARAQREKILNDGSLEIFILSTPFFRPLPFDARKDLVFRPVLVAKEHEIGRGFVWTANREPDREPAWSPDGEWIAFVSSRHFNVEIYLGRAKAHGQIGGDLHKRRITNMPRFDGDPCWHPSGRRIFFTSDKEFNESAPNRDIYAIDIDPKIGAHRNLVRITKHPAADEHPTVSPDGGMLAFSSGRYHKEEPEVKEEPEEEKERYVSPLGKLSAVWGRLKLNSD